MSGSGHHTCVKPYVAPFQLHSQHFVDEPTKTLRQQLSQRFCPPAAEIVPDTAARGLAEDAEKMTKVKSHIKGQQHDHCLVTGPRGS